MKPYLIRIHSKQTAQAMVDFFVAGLQGNESTFTPEEQDAVDIMTRLGEWSEEDAS